MWLSMTGLGIYAYQNGDYRLILYPLDYAGNVCGTDYGNHDMREYPYLYYVNDFAGGVCVKVREREPDFHFVPYAQDVLLPVR